jgi:hypothetical protein
MRIVVEYGWRGLVVLLIGDVGHCHSKVRATVIVTSVVRYDGNGCSELR